jgi:branched-chain amino acid transport system ATP-binding protein
VALLGTNGAGKSTLLKAMVGLVPSKGSVRLGGTELRGRSTEQIVREGVALMPGGKSIFPTLSVAEHLRLATWTFRREADRIDEDTEALLELFPALRRRLHNMAGDLSGGEQQQLALAQTLLLRPRVLLIDELSLGLSPTIVAQLIDVVRALHEQGATIVVVEQSVNVALTLAERAVFMEKGQVRFEGATRELLDRPDILRSVFIQGAGAQAAAGGASSAAGDSAIGTVDVSALAALEPLVLPDDGPVLSCTALTKRFGGVVAVDHVDLEVGPGEIVGLVGQNGAGKTTIVDCISGFHQIDGGVVRFRGRDVSGWAPHERARARLGRSFQEARLFPSLTVAETIAVACERQAASRSLVADAFRQPASYESELLTAARVQELIGLLGLVDHRDKLTSELSTGTRRIVELACLMAEEPVLLLLDEPSAGVAQRETEALGPLLRRIRDVTGVAMIVIEHDMPLLSGLCERLVALELGAVIATGTPDEV